MTFRRTVSLILLLGTVGGAGCAYTDRDRRFRAFDNDDGRYRRWERRDDRRDWRDYRQQRRGWSRDRDRDDD